MSEKVTDKQADELFEAMMKCDICGAGALTGGYLIHGVLTCAQKECAIKALERSTQDG